MSGPYETSRDALEDARVLRESMAAADPGTGSMTQAVIAARSRARLQYLRGVLEVCGVQLGAYDKRIAEWVASWDLETIQVVAGWVERAHAAANVEPATLERARYSWVLYKPQAGHSGILEAAGSEGTAVGLVDPVQLAADMLAEHSFGADAGDCVVKAFGSDDRLVAWSQWEDGVAVAYLPQGGAR